MAGAGIVEARSQNIAVGAPVPGIVLEIPVSVGSRVKRGDPLFRVDDREARAELAVRATTLASARAELARLESLPRAEDLPPAEARIVAFQTALDASKNQLRLAEGLTDKSAMAVEEWDRRRFAVRSADARLAESKGDLAKLKAGAWKPELEVARTAAAAAQAKVEAQEVALERLVVRAPVDGTVLDRMHVRVDIDENDAWRFRPGAKAEAFVRGNRDLKAPLEFVRVEPYVIPKRSLTGESTERVDTRVLQVLYSFDPKALTVYVGQQMDVFIEAASGAEVTKP